MVYFEQHVKVTPETEVLVQRLIYVLLFIGIFISCSIVMVAVSLYRLSYVLLARGHEQAIAHHEHQTLDERKHK
jgi:hypothetical protein